MEARARGEVPAPVQQSLEGVARQKRADAYALRSVADSAAANQPKIGQAAAALLLVFILSIQCNM
jgi:hypothetical protein